LLRELGAGLPNIEVYPSALHCATAEFAFDTTGARLLHAVSEFAASASATHHAGSAAAGLIA